MSGDQGNCVAESQGTSGQDRGSEVASYPVTSLLQLTVLAPTGTIGSYSLGAAAEDFAVLPPAWQKVVLVVQAGVGAPLPPFLMAAAVLLLGYIMLRVQQPLPHLMFCFNGDMSKMAYFLAQTWHHMNTIGGVYSDDADWVHPVASNLEDGTARWVVSLQDSGQPRCIPADPARAVRGSHGSWCAVSHIAPLSRVAEYHYLAEILAKRNQMCSHLTHQLIVQ